VRYRGCDATPLGMKGALIGCLALQSAALYATNTAIMATQQLDLQEQEQLDQIKHFWNTWGPLISGVLMVVLCGLVAWNGYLFWQNRQAQQAATLAEAVEAAAAAGDVSRAQQAFESLQSDYGSTAQAGQAGLLAAKVLADAGKWEEVKPILTWVAEKAADEGYRALARLRLAGVLLEEKAYDEALAQLSARFPESFTAMVADRKGDVLALQDKKAEAIEAYRSAWQAFEGLDARVQYRSLVEAKLNALGAKATSKAGDAA